MNFRHEKTVNWHRINGEFNPRLFGFFSDKSAGLQYKYPPA